MFSAFPAHRLRYVFIQNIRSRAAACRGSLSPLMELRQFKLGNWNYDRGCLKVEPLRCIFEELFTGRSACRGWLAVTRANSIDRMAMWRCSRSSDCHFGVFCMSVIGGTVSDRVPRIKQSTVVPWRQLPSVAQCEIQVLPSQLQWHSSFESVPALPHWVNQHGGGFECKQTSRL